MSRSGELCRSVAGEKKKNLQWERLGSPARVNIESLPRLAGSARAT